MSRSGGSADNSTPMAPPTAATPKVAKTNSKGSSIVRKSSADSPSSGQNPRITVDHQRSPKSVTSKLGLVDRKSPRVATPPEKKPQSRILKQSDPQAQLNAALDDLKKTKERLALVEKEKAQVASELIEMKKLADEANEKLQEALVSQKRAEESSEIEKFRAIEIEQAGIEVAQKKEDEWRKEIEAVRNQHAVDVAALLSATQELQRAKQELAAATEAKAQALSDAGDAKKNAEIHSEKVDNLSAELVSLKGLLDSKHEVQANDGKLVEELKAELESLKLELAEAKSSENKLVQMEESCERLNVELEASRMAESYAHTLLEECKNMVKELEEQVEEANNARKTSAESLGTVMKQLEGNHGLLHEAECEIASLKEKLALVEMSVGRQKGDLNESERHLKKTTEEATRAAKLVEVLRSELEVVKGEKALSLENEKLAASSIQTLLEEKNQLMDELETCREEEEKSKKVMESLASALHEVSTEAREAKEKLLSSQAEQESLEVHIDDLKQVLKATSEKYETMLDEAKHEIEHLTSSMNQSKVEYENQIEELGLALRTTNEKNEGMLDEAKNEINRLTNTVQQTTKEHSASKGDWEQRELQLVSCLKASEEEKSLLKEASEKYVTMLDNAKQEISNLKDVLKHIEEENTRSKAEWEEKELQLVNHLKTTEEEVSSMGKELARLRESLKEFDEKANAAEGESHLKSELMEARSALASLSEALEAAQSEIVKSRDSLFDKENELQNLMQENQHLRASVDFNVRKVAELSKMLEEFNAKNEMEEDKGLSDTEKDYDLLPKVVNFSEENGHRSDENPEKSLVSSGNSNDLSEEAVHLGATMNTDAKDEASETKTEENPEESAKVESERKMWESCKIEENEYSSNKEAEKESVDDELDSKADGSESFDHGNGLASENEVRISPSGQHKKKKPLYRKFGSLLKKGISNKK
ncbi:WEB family protein, chloroplastic-like protein [Drosera capensis]